MRSTLAPIAFALVAASCQVISGLSSVNVTETGGAGSSQQTTTGTTTATTTTGGGGGQGAICADYCGKVEQKCQGAELQFPSSDVCGAFCAFLVLNTPALDCRLAALQQNLPNACARAGPAGYQCDDRCAACQNDAGYFCGAVQNACDGCDIVDLSNFSWNGCTSGASPPVCAVYFEALMMTYGPREYCLAFQSSDCPATTACDGPP